MTDQLPEVKRGPGRPRLNESAIDDVKETVSEFMDKIAQAKHAGEESIEASPEIIAHYNRNGLNGAKFFIYSGIKVYPTGKTQEIEDEINTPLGQTLHGAQEGKLENR
jgi:hypothetical protein